jgi:hypothetical protein
MPFLRASLFRDGLDAVVRLFVHFFHRGHAFNLADREGFPNGSLGRRITAWGLDCLGFLPNPG